MITFAQVLKTCAPETSADTVDFTIILLKFLNRDLPHNSAANFMFCLEQINAANINMDALES